MRKIKTIYFGLLNKKFEDLREKYNDEITYFMDLLDNFIGRDFYIKKSLIEAEKAAKYYVNPHLYKSLVEKSDPELHFLDKIHK